MNDRPELTSVIAKESISNYIQAGAFRSFAIRNGNLVTGQQDFSGAETARLILEAVGR